MWQSEEAPAIRSAHAVQQKLALQGSCAALKAHTALHAKQNAERGWTHNSGA